MAVKIRCRRVGANNDLCFRIVAADIRSARDGSSLEILGWYDPKREGKNYSLKLEAIEAWVRKGAQVTETVRSLVNRARRDAASALAASAAAASEQPPAEAPAAETAEKPAQA
ncbi:MAG: 30S ribosomal protein S16 [Lentisphaerae bacterium]|nr:30S ribosomal protein S16 [Lentisphaerota bacterium]